MQNQNKHSDGEVHDINLRDYYATKAMQGFLASGNSTADDFNPDCEVYKGGVPAEFNIVAKNSYLMADAMMKARVRK